MEGLVGIRILKHGIDFGRCTHSEAALALAILLIVDLLSSFHVGVRDPAFAVVFNADVLGLVTCAGSGVGGFEAIDFSRHNVEVTRVASLQVFDLL